MQPKYPSLSMQIKLAGQLQHMNWNSFSQKAPISTAYTFLAFQMSPGRYPSDTDLSLREMA